jgi:hypothetical protein
VIDFIGNKAKFRIIKRNNRYVVQEFYGFWKIGFYLTTNYLTRPIALDDGDPFEHINYSDAEYVVYKLMKKRKQKGYIIKEYI